MLSSKTIADSLLDFHKRQTEIIEAFWIESSNSRQTLASELEALIGDHPILIAAVASGQFTDPNGVVDELSLTIEENEKWFSTERRSWVIRDQKFSIVLVSKRALGVPQISSPVTLPEWFPLYPGRLLTTNIKSIKWDISLSLASSDIPEAAINSAIFDLEAALGARLSSALQATHHAIASLETAINCHPKAPKSIGDLLRSSSEGIRSRTGDEFRPGGAIDSGFIVSHLARLWRDCPPKDRHSLAATVSTALNLDNVNSMPSQLALTSLLTRGKESFLTTPSSVMFCRNLMGVLSDVVQFINAKHHADEFPQFPAVLTIAFARELANSCKSAASALKALS